MLQMTITVLNIIGEQLTTEERVSAQLVREGMCECVLPVK